MLIVHFFTSNLLISAGVAVALIFFFYKKPAETIKFIGFAALLVAVLYVMSLLTESGTFGVTNKHDAAEKTERELSQ